MKKILAIITALMLCNCAYSQEVKTCDLRLNSEYIILLDGTAQSFGISDPNILHIRTVTTLMDDKVQVLLTPIDRGKTSVAIKYTGGEKNYVFTIVDHPKKICEDVIEIDLPERAGD